MLFCPWKVPSLLKYILLPQCGSLVCFPVLVFRADSYHALLCQIFSHSKNENNLSHRHLLNLCVSSPFYLYFYFFLSFFMCMWSRVSVSGVTHLSLFTLKYYFIILFFFSFFLITEPDLIQTTTQNMSHNFTVCFSHSSVKSKGFMLYSKVTSCSSHFWLLTVRISGTLYQTNWC